MGALDSDPEWYHYVIVLGAMFACCLCWLVLCRYFMLRRARQAAAEAAAAAAAAEPGAPAPSAGGEAVQQPVRERAVALHKVPITTVEDDPEVATPQGWGLRRFVAERKGEAARRLQNKRYVERHGLSAEEADLGADYASYIISRPPGAQAGISCERGTTVVGMVDPGSPAERAGLPEGVRIVAVDGRRVHSPDEVVTAFAAGGTEVRLLVERSAVPPRPPAGGTPARSVLSSAAEGVELPPAHRRLLSAARSAGCQVLGDALRQLRAESEEDVSPRRSLLRRSGGVPPGRVPRVPLAADLPPPPAPAQDTAPDGSDAPLAAAGSSERLRPASEPTVWQHSAAAPPSPRRPPSSPAHSSRAGCGTRRIAAQQHLNSSSLQVPLWPSAWQPGSARRGARSMVVRGRAALHCSAPPLAPFATGVMMGGAEARPPGRYRRHSAVLPPFRGRAGSPVKTPRADSLCAAAHG
eukprot:TRINITY_DN2357_c5_g1_i1.p1 TRINITY_DN2357_c5_g1~~TRINITY_DN2357_c5_g1_i1.p1  ORF type:complete len:495 (+),score=132.89 TRINITY_DN2357_c5_g1_i1:85-1485(+)